MDIQLLLLKFCDYSTYIRGYSKATIQRYKWITNIYCKVAGVTTIGQVTEKNVKELFYYGRTQRGWKPNTFIVFHKSLLVFFRWCVQEGYMQSNPVESIELPKLEKRLPPKLTKQEVQRLLDIIYNYPYIDTFLQYRNHAIFSTFVLAGLRKSELLNLRYSDVDLENLTIFVRQGKGSKDRIVPMSFTLAQILKRYLHERQRANKTCPEFFTSYTYNGGFSDAGIRELVRKLRKITNIQFTIHKLRHTFATLMLEGGCDIYSLSRMMGHSDIKTTTIYLAASAEHLRSQISKHPLNDL